MNQLLKVRRLLPDASTPNSFRIQCDPLAASETWQIYIHQGLMSQSLSRDQQAPKEITLPLMQQILHHLTLLGNLS